MRRTTLGLLDTPEAVTDEIANPKEAFNMNYVNETGGPVLRATRERLEQLPEADGALAALALALASAMDRNPTASLGKELRETMKLINSSDSSQAREQEMMNDLVTRIKGS